MSIALFGDEELLGREAELEQLEPVLDLVASGRSHFLELSGEPGIGKSALLRAMLGAARERGFLAVAATATEFDSVPFSTATEALAGLLGALEPSRCHSLVRDHPAIRVVSPDFNRQDTDVPASGELRLRVHRAIRALIGAAAEQQATALALDDLQWADEATLDVFANLLRRPPEGPVLLVGADRRNALPARVAEALVAAEMAGDLTTVSLTPLSRATADRLMTEQGVPPDRRDRFFHVAGGNPFYLRQLATGTSGASGGHAALKANGSPIVVPRAVLDSLAGEVSRLSDGARRTAQLCAVIGEPVHAELVCEASTLDRETTLSLLDELVAADVLHSHGRGLVFRHPLVREAVYGLAPPSALLSAHAVLAEVLERHGASPAERAVHVAHSGRRGDESAVGLLSSAADEVGGQAPQTAARWVEVALGLLPATRPGGRLRLLEQRANYLAACGELEAAVGEFDTALRETPGSEHDRHARLIAQRASVERWLGSIRPAGNSLGRELARLPPGAGAARAELLLELAIGALAAREYGATRSRAADAIDTADRAGDPALAATAAAVGVLAALTNPDLGELATLAPAAKERLQSLSESQLTQRLDAQLFAAWSEYRMNGFEEAVALGEQGLELARQSGQVRHVAAFMMMLSVPLRFLGRIPEALETADGAVELARLLRNPHFLIQALFVRTLVSLWSGDFETGLGLAREQAALEREHAPSLALPVRDTGWTQGYLTAHAISPQKGLRMMVAASGGPSLQRVPPGERLLLLSLLSEVALAAGDQAAAEHWVEEAESATSQLPRGLASGWAHRARAELELGRRNSRQALTHARSALGDGQEVGLMPEIAAAQILIGRAESQLEQRDAAIAALRSADEMLGSSGCGRLQHQCAQALRALGWRVQATHGETHPDSDLSALTARENEIAELVAARLTNRKIGEKLYLSEKTVESHLRTIFRKLDVTSRVAVARLVEQARQEQRS